jgi:aminomethyltransferase
MLAEKLGVNVMKRSPFSSKIAEQRPSWAVVQGWKVPSEFTTAAEEHQAVRERVGLLDWSTTGEFEVQGPDALQVVQRVIVNDAARMPVNRVLYTSILNEDGGIMSDWGSNAANERPEYDLLREHSKGLDACVFDASPGVGLLALQGPQAGALLSDLTKANLGSLKYMWATPAQVAGIRALISRTGYTGELGYEVLVPVEHAHDFWVAVTQAGGKYGLALCGMDAAFSLRMEKGYIMRFDFAGGRTPYETGLGWTVKLGKGDFVGREALIRRKEAGFRDKLVSLAVQDGFVPANGDTILERGEEAGAVTSAAFGYTLGTAIALGYVPLSLAEVGTAVAIEDREGNSHPAVVGPRSPYDPNGTRLRG